MERTIAKERKNNVTFKREQTMRDFIINFLIGVMNSDTSEFASDDFKVSSPTYGSIKISGKKNKDEGTFNIRRTLPNGDRCSGIPVMGMPLTRKNIEYIADLACENL